MSEEGFARSWGGSDQCCRQGVTPLPWAVGAIHLCAWATARPCVTSGWPASNERASFRGRVRFGRSIAVSKERQSLQRSNRTRPALSFTGQSVRNARAAGSWRFWRRGADLIPYRRWGASHGSGSRRPELHIRSFRDKPAGTQTGLSIAACRIDPYHLQKAAMRVGEALKGRAIWQTKPLERARKPIGKTPSG